MSVPTYTITAIKTFRAMEGQGFNAKLLRDGKPVALVDDAGCGGPLDFSWMDRTAPRVDVSVHDYNGGLHTYLGSPEEAMLAAHVLTLPSKEIEGTTFHESLEGFVAGLVDEALTRRDMKRHLKAKTLFVIGAKKGLYSIKGTGPGAEICVLSKYPDAKILNRLPEAEALALYVEHGA